MINRNLWLRGCALAVLLICTLGLSHPLRAEQPEQSSTTPQIQTTPAADPETGQGQPTPPPRPPKDDRIFFALPNYATVENAASLPPLTTTQKFKIVAMGVFDPVEFAFIGVESGVNQAYDTNPTYGQGLIGYSKRYGTAFADIASGNFMTGAVFPSLLRQDPRYYQMGKGKLLHRAGHAAMRVLITRSDSGKSQFNFSEFLGNGVAAGISNVYHPGPRTLGSNVNVCVTQTALDAFAYELKEFWPDIHRLLKHGNHNM